MRDLGALASAVAQPKASIQDTELYPTLAEKANALCFSLCRNHPFIDGNKRVAHAAMSIFLNLNGMVIDATVDEQERIMLELASGALSREELLEWLQGVVKPK